MIRFVQARRWLGLMAAGAAAVLTVSLAPAAAAPATAAPGEASYRVTDLGTLPGLPGSAAFGVNNNGDVVGTSGARPVLWRNGRIIDLLGSAGGYGVALDINERGDVVGYLFRGTYSAFLWRDGRMVELPGLPGDRTVTAEAINDRGQIVGSSSLVAPRSVLWQPDGTVVDLTATGLLQVRDLVNNLNNGGQLVGRAALGSLPALWSHGQTTVLSGTSGSATAINDRGEVAGYFDVGGESFVWRDGNLTVIPLLPDLPPGSVMRAQAINNRGEVVGWFSGGEGFVWYQGTLDVLPHLYGYGTVPYGINDRGQIVGWGVTSSEDPAPHAVLLTPAA
jgi:probable HAF family extracellular repeat protein